MEPQIDTINASSERTPSYRRVLSLMQASTYSYAELIEAVEEREAHGAKFSMTISSLHLACLFP